MEFKGTKGKWECQEVLSNNGRQFISIFEEGKDVNGNSIAGIWDLTNKDFANAKLIAAAPEMFGFISEMVKRYPNSPWICDEGNRVLTKITE